MQLYQTFLIELLCRVKLRYKKFPLYILLFVNLITKSTFYELVHRFGSLACNFIFRSYFFQVQGHSHVQILNGNNEGDSVGEKLCKHKYSSYPYCYSDIKSNKDGHEHHRSNVTESPKPKVQDEKL